MVDFGDVLRRARENAAETGGYHGYRGNRESDPQDIKGLADGGMVATETTAVATSGNQIEYGSHSNHRAEAATAEWIPKNAIDNNELACTVSTVATVATKNTCNAQKLDDGLGAAAFLAAIQTIWPEASMLTEGVPDCVGYGTQAHRGICWAFAVRRQLHPQGIG